MWNVQMCKYANVPYCTVLVLSTFYLVLTKIPAETRGFWFINMLLQTTLFAWKGHR
jgi:hypothetical protein